MITNFVVDIDLFNSNFYDCTLGMCMGMMTELLFVETLHVNLVPGQSNLILNNAYCF